MSIFNPTEEEKLHRLISQALQLDVGKKTKAELIELLQSIAKQSDWLLHYIDERVKFRETEKMRNLELLVKRKDESLNEEFECIRKLTKELNETKEALAEATCHSENWGGAREGAGRKPTGIKRFSRKVICTSRMAAAFAEYGKQLGKKTIKSILKKQKLEEKWDTKIRYLFLSKDEWDIVMPIYNTYRKKGQKAIEDC